MDFKYVIALFIALIIPMCLVQSQKQNLTSINTHLVPNGQIHLVPNGKNQSVTLYRSRRCYTDKYYELKKHEFDSLISLLKFKFTQFLLLIVWIKQIWLRILSVPLSKAGVEFTKADLQGPFQHLLGIQRRPITRVPNAGIHGVHNDIRDELHGAHEVHVKELNAEDGVLVRSKRARPVKTITQLVLQAAKETIFAPFIAVYKLVKTVFGSIFRLIQFMYHLYEYDACRYKTICLATEYVWDRIPAQLSEYLLTYIGEETFDKLLESENEYLNAFVTGMLDLNCNSSYNHFC